MANVLKVERTLDKIDSGNWKSLSRIEEIRKSALLDIQEELYRPLYQVALLSICTFGLYPIYRSLKEERLYKHKVEPLVREENSIYGRGESVFKGNIGEEQVAKILEQGLSNEFYVINDLLISADNKHAQIDHVVVGPSGIYCLETKHIRGTFYPYNDKWRWTPYKKNIKSKTIVSSPQQQSEYHVKILKRLLNKMSITLPIEALVVLTNSECEWRGPLGVGKTPVLYKGMLLDYFRSTLGNQKQSIEKTRQIANIIVKLDHQHRSNLH